MISLLKELRVVIGGRAINIPVLTDLSESAYEKY